MIDSHCKKTKSFFSPPRVLLIHHTYPQVILRSQIFILSVGPTVAGDEIPSALSLPAPPPRYLQRFHFFTC